MTERAIAVLDQHIATVGRASDDAKARGDMDMMYKLNTAWHWLNAARLDLMDADGERSDTVKEG